MFPSVPWFPGKGRRWCCHHHQYSFLTQPGQSWYYLRLFWSLVFPQWNHTVYFTICLTISISDRRKPYIQTPVWLISPVVSTAAASSHRDSFYISTDADKKFHRFGVCCCCSFSSFALSYPNRLKQRTLYLISCKASSVAMNSFRSYLYRNVSVFPFFLVFFFFFKDTFSLCSSSCPGDSLCRPGWARTHRDSPAPTSQALN